MATFLKRSSDYNLHIFTTDVLLNSVQFGIYFQNSDGTLFSKVSSNF